ncbi:NAD(P)H-hydrate dehydratase [Flavihumibacter sp. R14]|nr:NAD(P)H-hydrate dehydratase [Flavihumibacter soli]
MQTLLTSEQTRRADKFTIGARGIASIDLMESAATAFVSAFKGYFAWLDVAISIYCGTGNNGADGLAIARLLKEQGYDRLSVKIARFGNTTSEDFRINLERLKLTGISVTDIAASDELHSEDADIIIDALLGSGLSRPLDGEFDKLAVYLNNLGKTIVSVDVPTGFPSEDVIRKGSTIIKAGLAISFQRPRINFFFPESAPYIKRFRSVDIGLDESFIQSQPREWTLLEPDDIREIMKPREAFSHKGTFGHALIVAGNTGTMGAALLCADACLHSGAGLTTACIPAEGLSALNSFSPEVMYLPRNKSAEIDFAKYQAIAIGPGLGTDDPQVKLLKHILSNISSQVVMDADALNIISRHPEILGMLPHNVIFTPHLKEFDRLFGAHNSWWERVATGRSVARQHAMIIIIKNRYTFIILPDGNVVINPTGNPAMATGGTGDVLTGVIAGLLAQGYSPEQAALAGVYLHGKAGDILAECSGMYSIPSRYLIKKLPEVIGSYASE